MALKIGKVVPASVVIYTETGVANTMVALAPGRVLPQERLYLLKTVVAKVQNEPHVMMRNADVL